MRFAAVLKAHTIKYIISIRMKVGNWMPDMTYENLFGQYIMTKVD